MSTERKHALITGSSRGIGRGIALKMAENGVNVAINYVQNEKAALDTLAQVRERGADGFIVQADVSRPRCDQGDARQSGGRVQHSGYIRQQRPP